MKFVIETPDVNAIFCKLLCFFVLYSYIDGKVRPIQLLQPFESRLFVAFTALSLFID